MQCGSEEEKDYVAAEDEDDDEAESGDGIESFEGVVRQQVAHDAAGVQRWNRQEVKEKKSEVNLDREPEQHGDSLGCGGNLQEDLTLHCADDGLASAGHDEGQQYQEQEGDEGEQQIGGGTRQGDDVVIARDVLEVAGDYWNGLAPADDRASAEADEGPEDHERRIDDSAKDIDVAHRIEGDAALKTRGVVAHARGHPGMRTLVYGEREKQDDKLIERNEEIDT